MLAIEAYQQITSHENQVKKAFEGIMNIFMNRNIGINLQITIIAIKFITTEKF